MSFINATIYRCHNFLLYANPFLRIDFLHYFSGKIKKCVCKFVNLFVSSGEAIPQLQIICLLMQIPVEFVLEIQMKQSMTLMFLSIS